MQQCGASAESLAFYHGLLDKAVPFLDCDLSPLKTIRKIFEPIACLDLGYFCFESLIEGKGTIFHAEHHYLLRAIVQLAHNRVFTVPFSSRYPTGAHLHTFVTLPNFVVAEFISHYHFNCEDCQFFCLFFSRDCWAAIKQLLTPSELGATEVTHLDCKDGLYTWGTCDQRIGRVRVNRTGLDGQCGSGSG